MKILFAGDEHPYSAFALQEVIRLALNTWADVTLLAVSAAPAGRDLQGYGDLAPDQPLPRVLNRYRETFLKAAGEEESPYAPEKWQYEWV
ncbi:MAG: hypothetical protein L6277_13125, partial [Desulfobacterales bacterium]|nr:hypothetical protein [Desulfobacterales bacterium]